MEMVLNTHLSHEFQPCINLLFILWLFIFPWEAMKWHWGRRSWPFGDTSGAWSWRVRPGRMVCALPPVLTYRAAPLPLPPSLMCGWGFHWRFHLGEKNLMDRLVCVLSSSQWGLQDGHLGLDLFLPPKNQPQDRCWTKVSILPLTCWGCYLAFPGSGSKKPGVRNEQRPFKWFLSILGILHAKYSSILYSEYSVLSPGRSEYELIPVF